MARVTPLLTDFSGGAISERVLGRIDTQFYRRSCRRLENFVAAPDGPVDRRPGTTYVATTRNNNKARLIPFKYDDDTQYMLELTEGYIRVIKDGALVGAPYELGGLPWVEADLFEVQYDQDDSGVMVLVHKDYAPRELTRVADDNWTIGTIAFTDPLTKLTGAGNYPAAVAFYAQRLWLAGTANNPLTVFASRAPATTTPYATRYYDFTRGANDDDSIEYILASTRRCRIQWLAAKNDVLVGTTNDEWLLTGDGAPLTPSNVRPVRQGTQGSMYLQPIQAGNKVLFVERNGRTVREYGYVRETDNYRGVDVTARNREALGTGIVEWDIQTDPMPLVWSVRDDGKVAALTYEPDTGVVAWHVHPFSLDLADVESLGVIEGATEDQVLFSVQRTINGSSVRHIEIMKPFDWGSDDTDVFFVEDGITLEEIAAATVTDITNANPGVVTAASHGLLDGDLVRLTGVVGMTEVNGNVYTVANKTPNTFELSGVNTTTFTAYTSGGSAQKVHLVVTGLTHLEGETVQVCAEGANHPDRTVASGQITLQEYSYKTHVGLGYKSVMEPTKIEAGTQRGTAQHLPQKVHEIWARCYKSGAFKAGPTETLTRIVEFRDTLDVMDAAVPLFSGYTEEVSMLGDFDRDGHLLVIQDACLPLTVQALSVNVETEEH